MHGLNKVAEEQKFFQGKLHPLLENNWKGPFWKNCAAYLNGSGEAKPLIQSPLLKVVISDEKRYEKFLWGFLQASKNEVWKPRALALLKEKKWISYEIYYYLGKFMDSSMEQPLIQRLDLIRQGSKKKGNEMFEYEIDYPQDLLRSFRVEQLTYAP